MTWTLRGCLYGRREGTFFNPGLHENVSNRDDFPLDNLQTHIILSRQSGTECLYDKNCPALARIPVGIPLSLVSFAAILMARTPPQLLSAEPSETFHSLCIKSQSQCSYRYKTSQPEDAIRSAPFGFKGQVS